MNLKDEYFVDIPGYENEYKISNFGRIMVCKSSNNKPVGYIRKLQITQDGYYRVCLTKNDIAKTFLVHRLVALAFRIPNPENKRTINHKNCDKRDNRPENLEWASYHENINHAIKHGLRANNNPKHEKAHRAKLTNKQVLEIRKLRSKGYTLKELGMQFNVHSSTIGKITTGVNWKELNAKI